MHICLFPSSIVARYCTIWLGARVCRKATEALQTIARSIESVEIAEEQADAAAALKFIYKLGFADCFAAELAMRTGATLVTADPEFAKLGKKLKILALPRHKE